MSNSTLCVSMYVIVFPRVYVCVRVHDCSHIYVLSFLNAYCYVYVLVSTLKVSIYRQHDSRELSLTFNTVYTSLLCTGTLHDYQIRRNKDLFVNIWDSFWKVIHIITQMRLYLRLNIDFRWN